MIRPSVVPDPRIHQADAGLAVMDRFAALNSPAADPLVGKTIAQYEVVAKLGGGGMGVVYTARDTKLGRLVALKFLPPQWSHDDNAKQRFIREAQAASATDHRNICTIYNIESTDDGRLFIVMAHYEGRTLKQKLEAGALGMDEALEIAAQVAEGLAKAHAQGVVHRDIKPGNLMITDDTVKILDFGLAKFADSLQLTIVGSTLGTVAYMSPEQTKGQEADARSDLWAVGVVLYEMLTGQVPFKGTYPEAISYAIRNDLPPPLRAAERDIPEEVERLVLRALAKDPAERFQSARELARDIRLLQGRSVPIELRTEALPPLVRTLPLDRRPRRRRLRNFTIAAVAMAAVMAGTALWLFSPIERIPVAVAPVANQTGYTELEPYRLALTQTLIDELSDSRHIRVLPYQRLLQIVRGFLPGGADPSSREVIQAVARHSAARLVIVPTLIRENSGWRARAEFRSADTATNAAVYETDPVVSSLVKDTAYALTSSLADGIREHFTATGPRKVRITDTMRRMAGYKLAPAAHRMRTLDAAMAFEQGVNAYDQLEFAAARRFFTSAAEQDPRDPLARAWLARAAQLVRQDDGAQEAATRAAPLVTAETPDRDAVLVAAVTAEARRDVATAEARYRDLMARYPDEPMWLVELASFQDRQTRTSDAIAGYRQALELDSRMPRPYLELCRLYNRLNESASAKEEGERALSAYRALGNRGGEAQALMCLTDMLRLGDDKQRVEARRDAEAALKIFQELGYAYNVARAQYYIALAAEAQGRPAEAVAVYEKSLASARDAGNVVLEPLVLMNLGAMQGKLGKQSSALDFHQQSHTLYEKFGDEQRAAQNQANVGAILIEYGGRSEEGLRDVQNALGVFRKVGDKTFEMFAAKVTATHDRYAGRHAEAERELNRAIALAREWGMEREIPALMIAIARSRFDMSDYAAARENLLRALEDGSGKDSVEARILLGLTHVRLGQFDRAQADLSQALRDVQKGGDTGHLPLLDTAMGELAYESGRPRDARIYYGEASALWTDDLPDPASVQARASLGLLDGLAGRPAAARAAILASLEHARRTGPLSLEARCRVHLARIDVAAQDFEDALNTLSAITTHRERALGPELQAQVHYWRSRALRGRGDRARAESEEGVARKLIKDLRASLPQQYQDGFAARADIHRVIE